MSDFQCHPSKQSLEVYPVFDGLHIAQMGILI